MATSKGPTLMAKRMITVPLNHSASLRRSPGVGFVMKAMKGGAGRALLGWYRGHCLYSQGHVVQA